jgi:hypothetical protein
MMRSPIDIARAVGRATIQDLLPFTLLTWFVQWITTVDPEAQGLIPRITIGILGLSFTTSLLSKFVVAEIAYQRVIRVFCTTWVAVTVAWMYRITPQHDHPSGLVPAIVLIWPWISAGFAMQKVSHLGEYEPLQRYVHRWLIASSVVAAMLWIWGATAITPPLPFALVGILGVTMANKSLPRSTQVTIVGVLIISVLIAYPLTTFRYTELERTRAACLSGPWGNGPRACANERNDKTRQSSRQTFALDGHLYYLSSVVHLVDGTPFTGQQCDEYQRVVEELAPHWYLVETRYSGAGATNKCSPK